MRDVPYYAGGAGEDATAPFLGRQETRWHVIIETHGDAVHAISRIQRLVDALALTLEDPTLSRLGEKENELKRILIMIQGVLNEVKQ